MHPLSSLYTLSQARKCLEYVEGNDLLSSFVDSLKCISSVAGAEGLSGSHDTAQCAGRSFSSIEDSSTLSASRRSHTTGMIRD